MGMEQYIYSGPGVELGGVYYFRGWYEISQHEYLTEQVHVETGGQKLHESSSLTTVSLKAYTLPARRSDTACERKSYHCSFVVAF